MEDSVKQRLVCYLKAKKIGQNKFERLAGLSNGYISNLKNAPSVDKVEKIFNAAPDLNRAWLLSGEGEMLVEAETKPTELSDYSLPYFEDYDFGCSPSGFLQAIKRDEVTEYVALPGLKNDGDTFVVPAKGESMVNAINPERSIPNGSLVVVRRTTLSTPRWGEVYALATPDGCIIKRLYPSEREGCVKCVSFNSEEYPAFELEAREIYDIGIVVKVVNVTDWS